MKLKHLVLVTFVLAFFVVIKGAYTRLVDAGLGCPDWPGCYGFILPPKSAEDQQIANQLYPERPLEISKAWPEMIHRYMASVLGLLIIAVAVVAWRKRNENVPYRLALCLVPLVIFQGILGMWTVTMGLFPPVVMGHLLGGFLTLALLGVMLVSLYFPGWFGANNRVFVKSIKGLASVAFVLVLMQVALGGWTSANYAALVCTDLPICESGWTELLDFKNAFSVGEANNNSYEFGVLPAKARLTIHVMHRIGAIIVALILIGLIIKMSFGPTKIFAGIIAALLIGQIALGVSNVVFQLPLAVAVAHNAVGALLLTSILLVVVIASRQNVSVTRD